MSLSCLGETVVTFKDEYSNHASDKHPQSEKINVHALYDLIEILKFILLNLVGNFHKNILDVAKMSWWLQKGTSY